MSEGHSNGSASSSSSFNGSFEDTEDDHAIAIILAEEENLKRENKLGKRLSHLDSIPHTPRINGEIPHVDEATLNHGLLSERLIKYGLEELKMEGDGNCQFRALADQLFHNPEYHRHVRKKTIKQLKRFRKLYEGYVPMKYKTYLKKMKKSGEWGDHLTLQAAADRFGAKICVITSFRDTCYIEILPKDENPSKGKDCFRLLPIGALVELLERSALQFIVWYWRGPDKNSTEKTLAFLDQRQGTR